MHNMFIELTNIGDISLVIDLLGKYVHIFLQ